MDVLRRLQLIRIKFHITACANAKADHPPQTRFRIAGAAATMALPPDRRLRRALEPAAENECVYMSLCVAVFRPSGISLWRCKSPSKMLALRGAACCCECDLAPMTSISISNIRNFAIVAHI